jgi:hypothetical protein
MIFSNLQDFFIKKNTTMTNPTLDKDGESDVIYGVKVLDDEVSEKRQTQDRKEIIEYGKQF